MSVCRCLPRVTLTALALGVVVPAHADAQVPADTTAVQVIRRVTEERWIHEDAPPEFVPTTERVEAFHAREIRSPMLRDPVWTVTAGLVDAEAYFDESGRIRSVQMRLPALSSTRWDDAADRRRNGVWRLQGRPELRAVALRLPSSRFRELWVPLPREDLAAGERWIDTLAFVAEPGEGLSESYRSVRRFEVLGDTMTGGGRALRIRMVEEVQYEATDLDVLLKSVRPVDRTLAGRTRGIALVEPETMLRVGGADTARWEGRAVLRDSVSGPLTSGVRMERVRTWTRYDSASLEALQDSMRAARARASTGMLMLPTTDLQRRLRAGDPVLADSLVERWRVSRDPDEIAELQSLLRRYDTSGTRTADQMDSLARVFALAREDTLTLLRTARGHIPYSRRLTVADAERVLPYLEDPGRLWRLGAPARYDYLELAGTLLRSGPIAEPDSTRWGCEPAACRLMIERGAASSEPRLRDAALVGRFAWNPARWFDSLVVRQEEGATLVAEAIRYGRGVARKGAPAVPPAGADWTAWRSWWNGGGRDRRQILRALRLYAARTGRDPMAELVAGWPPADDSARVVLEEILRAADAIPARTADELRADVLSGDEARVRSARWEIRRRMGEGEVVDPQSVVAVLVPLVDSIFAGGAYPWPAIPGAQSLQGIATSSHGVEEVPRFLLSANLPQAVLDAPLAGVTVVTPEEWQARDLRAGGHIFDFRAPMRWGPFLALSWRWTAYLHRAADEAPKGYSGGGSLILVQTERRVESGGSGRVDHVSDVFRLREGLDAVECAPPSA